MALFYEDKLVQIDVIQVLPGSRYRVVLLFKKAVSKNESIYEETQNQQAAFELAGKWMRRHSTLFRRPLLF